MVVLALSGCQVIRHDYRGRRQLTPGTKLLTPSSRLGEVEGSRKAKFLFFGLLPVNDGSGAALAEELAVAEYGEGVTGITQIRIDEFNTAGDVLLNLVVGFLFSTRTVHVTGIAWGGPGE